MKSVLLMTLLVVCCATLSFADEPQDLPPQAMASVQQQTREMAAVGIPEAPAREMLTLMVRNRFEHRNRIRAQQMVMETARAGLPTEPVMDKAMEGMAKQVGEAQILQAMESVRSRYAVAHRMTTSMPIDKARVSSVTREVADSLAAGMRPADVEAIMDELRMRTIQQTRNQADNLALQTLRNVSAMARLGIPSADVEEIMGNALRNRYTYREMMQLRIQMAKQVRFASPQKIARQHADTIGKGMDAGHSGSGRGGSNTGSGGGGSGGGSSGGGGSGGGSGGSGGGGGQR